jgi:DNA-binding NarL/FixJ family response regulator
MTLRVLLADDHALFRKALRMTLESHPDLVVVAEVSDGLGVIDGVGRHSPDVVCMDVNMPGLNGIEATQRLLAVHPGIRVVAMSADADPLKVAQMIDSGAMAYVLKINIGRELPLAIRSVSRDQCYFSPEIGIKD